MLYHLYKLDDYETKLTVLYALNNLKQSPTYTILSQVVSSSVDVQYFELQEYLQALVEMESVEEAEIDGITVYVITELGVETCQYFSNRIPASVREKVVEAAKLVNNDKSDQNKVYADYIPINEKEYKVVCGIMEDNVKLLDFQMYVGPKDRAKKICAYFKDFTNEFYMNIISHLEENMNKTREEEEE